MREVGLKMARNLLIFPHWGFCASLPSQSLEANRTEGRISDREPPRNRCNCAILREFPRSKKYGEDVNISAQDSIRIVNKVLRSLDNLSDPQLREFNRALAEAYDRQQGKLIRLVREVERANPEYIRAELAKLEELRIARSLVSPQMARQFEEDMAAVLQESTQHGTRLADELVAAYAPGSEIPRQFGQANVEAAAQGARQARQRLRNHANEAARQITQIVSSGVLNGEGVLAIRRRLESQFNLLKSRAENIARTETMSAMNAGAHNRYQDYGVKQYQVIALIDTRTTVECRYRHMKIIGANESKPPYHPSCRSIIAPFDPKWLSEDDYQWMSKEIKKASDGALNRASVFERLNGIAPPNARHPKELKSKKGKQLTPRTKRKNTKTPLQPPSKPKQANSNSPDREVTKYKIPASDREKQIALGKEFVEKQTVSTKDIKVLKTLETKKQQAYEKFKNFKGSEADKDKLFDEYLDSVDNLKRMQRKISAASAIDMQRIRNAIIEQQKALGYSEEKTQAILDSLEWDNVRSPTKKKVKTALEDFLNLTGGKGSQSLEIIVLDDDRPYASQSGDINIGRERGDRSPTIFHEMGHHLEFSEKGSEKAARTWIESRATGKPRKLSQLTPLDYDDDEIAIPDKFIDPYVGKIYEDKSTEVYAMGLQHFVSAKEMETLYRQDPEHFHLIVGAILRR